MKKTFKIDKQDHDLATFERIITSMHPEFQALREDGKPSYEHPQFHHITPSFRFLPGNNEPYCIHALNIFEKEDVEDYAWECQTLLERPISQLVESDDGEREIRIAMKNMMDKKVYLHHVENVTTTLTMKLTELVDYCCGVWHRWLATQVKANVAHKNAWFSGVLLDEVVEACAHVANSLDYLSKLEHLSNDKFSDLRVNQKYALLAKSFLQMYLKQIDGYVEGCLNELRLHLFKTMEYEKELRIETKRYVDLVLMHQLSIRSAKLEMEHNASDDTRKIELKTPSTFIYIQRHGGYKASEIRSSYRWLYIKAWLYSWLKENKVSANKAALAVAEDDRFFYLDKVLRRAVETDNAKKASHIKVVSAIERAKNLIKKENLEKVRSLKETDDECFSRRQKALNSEFSKWSKKPSHFGCISTTLFFKSEKGYRKQLDR